MNDIIIKNIKSLILPKKSVHPLKGKEMDELTIIDDAEVVINAGRIIYAGPSGHDFQVEKEMDAGGRIVSPALVEPHTHIVHGGSREHEMSL